MIDARSVDCGQSSECRRVKARLLDNAVAANIVRPRSLLKRGSRSCGVAKSCDILRLYACCYSIREMSR